MPGAEYENLFNLSLRYGGVGTSPGIWAVGGTYSSYHLDHVAPMPTQPLSCSTAASNSGTGVGGGGKGGRGYHTNF